VNGGRGGGEGSGIKINTRDELLLLGARLDCSVDLLALFCDNISLRRQE
jgi:hypothetical protein